LSKPITKEDIRFIDFWKEQRKGSVAKYYFIYTLAWGFVVCLSSFFFIIFMGGISIIPIAQDNYKVALVISIGIISGFIIALISRKFNEKRYQKILEKVRGN
jgi:uncharacterized membrane protein